MTTDDKSVSDDKLREIIAGTKGVTPGPWYTTGLPWFRSDDGVIAGSPDGNIAYLIADCDDGFNPRDEYTGPFPIGDKDADAAHIARLDPQTVTAICEELLFRRSHQDGYRLVPVEPTEAMWDAFFWARDVKFPDQQKKAQAAGKGWKGLPAVVWAAMLAAAPSPKEGK